MKNEERRTKNERRRVVHSSFFISCGNPEVILGCSLSASPEPWGACSYPAGHREAGPWLPLPWGPTQESAAGRRGRERPFPEYRRGWPCGLLPPAGSTAL